MAQTHSSSEPDKSQLAVPEDKQEPNLFSITLDWRRWWALLPEILTLTCSGILPLVVGANVLSRYTDWYRIPWAEDIVKVLFLWVVFLGGAVAVKYEAHVRMSLVSDRFNRWRAGALWDRVIRLSPVVVGAILLILGTQIVGISMHRELPSLQITVGYFMIVIPVSGVLMIYYAVRSLRLKHGRGSDTSSVVNA